RLGEELAAVRELRSTLRTAERLGIERKKLDASELLSLALIQLGSFREALSLYGPEDTTGLGPEIDASLFINRGWTVLAAMKAGVIPLDFSVPRKDYERALALLT